MIPTLPTEREIGISVKAKIYMKNARGTSSDDGRSELRLPHRSASPAARLCQPSRIDALVRSGNTPWSREASPAVELRGRMPTQLLTHPGASRENSQGHSEKRSRSPITKEVKVGIAPTERTRKQVAILEACTTDHYDAANWEVTGNPVGYYGRCKDCKGKMNDMVYWGPKCHNQRKNRYHGTILGPMDDPEDFPQDKMCLACGKSGCQPINCMTWNRFNPNGLDRMKGRPPKIAKSENKTTSEKSSTVSSNKTTPRGGKRASQSLGSSREKSPRTSVEPSLIKGTQCEQCGERIVPLGQVGCSCRRDTNVEGQAASSSMIPNGLGTPRSYGPDQGHPAPASREEITTSKQWLRNSTFTRKMTNRDRIAQGHSHNHQYVAQKSIENRTIQFHTKLSPS